MSPTNPQNKSYWFLQADALGGIILILATALSLYFANSSLRDIYALFLATPISISVAEYALAKPLLLWINDGMMAVFFFLVGLELKRELIDGQLSDRRRAALPIFAAIGGVVVPSLIYFAINFNDPQAVRGWAIPAATDIAFALGVLALLGSRVPTSLKVFLLAIAIIDDLAAIIIIAVFYTSQVSFMMLAVAAVGVTGLALLNIFRVTRLAPYVLVGAVVWVFFLKSGVHATLAGVVTALFVPHLRPSGESSTLLVSTEHELKPWVLFGIMPLFAFANAGVELGSLSTSDLLAPISLGIVLGLFLGKQLGICLFTWLAVRLGVASLPDGITWRHVHGVSLLAGIGFTMSLFIGTLAFSVADQTASVRIGVLFGSLLSGLIGFFVLLSATSTSRASPASNPSTEPQQAT